jgi:hypothetical protein
MGNLPPREYLLMAQRRNTIGVSTIEPGCSTHHQNAGEREAFLINEEVQTSMTHLPKERKFKTRPE